MRASFGIGTTVEHIDRLVAGLRTIVEQGPQLQYVEDQSTGDFRPVDDKRTFPSFSFLPSLDVAATPMGCGQF